MNRDLNVFEVKLKYTMNLITEYAKDSAILWSGGKDSTVLLLLALKVNPNIHVIFVDTGMEFPETLDYVSEITEKWNIRNLHILHPKISIWNILPSPIKYFLPCTYWLKIEPFIRFVKKSSIIIKRVFLGDRGDEHPERMKLLAKSLMHKNFAIPSIVSIYPLGYWKGLEVQRFIRRHNIPINTIYSKGYDRVGCIFCPYQNFKNLERYNPALLRYLLLKTNSKDLIYLKNNLSKIFIKEKI